MYAHTRKHVNYSESYFTRCKQKQHEKECISIELVSMGYYILRVWCEFIQEIRSHAIFQVILVYCQLTR